MATKLYLRTTTANVGTHAATKLSSVLATALATQPTAAARDLSTSAGAADATLTGTLANNTASVQRIYFGKWISPVILGGDITAQTWTIALNGIEANAAANQLLGVSIYVLASNDTVRGFVYDNAGSATVGAISTELGTTAAGRVTTISGSAVSGVLTTDQLCVEVWTLGQESGGGNTYAITTHYNGTVEPVDASASTNAAAYISTPQDLNNVTVSPPAGTASASGLVPVPALRVSPAAATTSASAPTPTTTVTTTIAAPVALASASAPLPTIAVSIAPAAAAATGSALLPALALQVPAPAATSSGSSLTPSISAGTGSQLVEPGVATANASARVPAVQLRIAAPVGIAAASAPTPGIALRLTPAAATASGSSPIPSTVIGAVMRAATDSGDGIEVTSQILWPIILRI